MPKFQYKALTGADIRIIRLRANVSPAAAIECTLIHAPLEGPNPASYEALSYVWGDATVRAQSIQLNGFPFQVTENLHAALRALRLPDGDRELWIDALCINQMANSEKSREVLRMLDIYRGARRVLVWLGEEAPSTGLAMSHLAELKSRRDGTAATPGILGRASRWLEFTYGLGSAWAKELFDLLVVQHPSHTVTVMWMSVLLYYWAWGNGVLSWAAYLYTLNHARKSAVHLALVVSAAWYAAWEKQVGASDVDAPSEEAIAALTEIFRRPWFTRIWVIQEVAAAREAVVVCGTHQTPWQTLRDGCRQMADRVVRWRRSRYQDTGFQRAHYVASSLDPDGTDLGTPALASRNLLYLLCQFHISDATVPHDKVYALLGLADEIQRPTQTAPVFTPDYSLPLDVAYARAARFLIDASDSFRVLGTCLGERRVEHLPSWVPDWSTATWKFPEGSRVFRFFDDDEEHHESEVGEKNAARHIVQYSDDGRTITVSGFRIGVLEGEPAVSETLDTDSERLFGRIFTIILYPLAEIIGLRVTWWFIGRLVDKMAPQDRRAEWMEVWGICKEYFTQGRPGRTPIYQLPLSYTAAEPELFRAASVLHTFNLAYDRGVRSIPAAQCSTRSLTARAGDVMWLVHGADMALILRPDGKRWTVVGPANYGPEHVLWKRCVKWHRQGRVSLQRLEIG